MGWILPVNFMKAISQELRSLNFSPVFPSLGRNSNSEVEFLEKLPSMYLPTLNILHCVTYEIAPYSQNLYYRNLSNIKKHCVTYYIAPLAKSEESLSSPGSGEEGGLSQSKRVVTFSSKVRWKTSQNSLRH